MLVATSSHPGGGYGQTTKARVTRLLVDGGNPASAGSRGRVLAEVIGSHPRATRPLSADAAVVGNQLVVGAGGTSQSWLLRCLLPGGR